MSNESLRRGDWVEVRSPAEILATLDERGMLENLPFMPEMAHFCGRRLRVDRRTERICDTVNYTGSLRLADAVMLEDLRCDGSAHGGCQASCRLIWKEAWLRRVDPNAPAAAPGLQSTATLIARIASQVRHSDESAPAAEELWRCQTTELLNAASSIPGLNLRSLLSELTTGNVSLGYFVRVMVRALLWEPWRKRTMLTSSGLLRGASVEPSGGQPLQLRPGEWVRVKSRAEIAATLSPTGHSRGLSFDREMLPFCGKSLRVGQRITRIIDERTGRMLRIKADVIALEHVVCSGECSARRLFCPRAIVPYWRECWLERIDPRNEPG